MKSFSQLSLARACAVILAITASLPIAQAGVVVNLGKLIIDLGPDGRTTRELEIVNTNDKAEKVSVFAADWRQDENGAVEAVDPSTEKAPDSATGWIGVNPQRFVLQKGEKKIVTVSLATPKGAAAMPLKEYRSMVFAETSDTSAQKKAMSGRELQVRVISRIGTKVFVRNPQGSAKLDCAVTKVEEKTREGKRGLEIRTINRGNVHIQSDNSKLAVRDGTGRTIESFPVSAFSILPGHERTIFWEIPDAGTSKLEKGKKYNALAVIDYGGNDLVAGDFEFTY
jgi:hypothetical protein